MAERRKLSISTPSADKPADRTRGWKVSPARAEALRARARAQRRDPTPAQAALWEHLKDKQLGFAFNREVVMGSTIADFACKPRWLVLEIGGTEGSEAAIAELSDRKLTEVGVRVLRFSDQQVLENIETVVAAIVDDLAKPFERPRIGRAG
ncbi:MAG: DUF559 domain-containing protein [Candidatus Andeanibacterium colombiense]|uniref:DUF559 domain-containing protein n=1 Tax=Candidatus Andeanibacterium colombiense TaxID=3121345 RepID=A0AAJ5X4G0_9SPHN|nr:MAG: DUF559 domain-containing protein [Sphingomonadaceae bacterium]